MNYAGRAAGATLGFILGNVPGAVAGYELMKWREKSSPKTMKRGGGYGPTITPKKAKIMKQPTRNKTARVVKFTRKPKNVSKAQKYQKRLYAVKQRKFRGKRGGTLLLESFKRPTRNGWKNIANIESECLSKGWGVTTEQVGTVTDEHAAYIYHGTYDMGAISFAIAGCLIRSLFRKAGIEINNLDEEVPFVDVNESLGMRIQLVTRNPINMTYSVTNVFETVAPTGVNKTFRDVVNDATTLRQYLEGYMKNSTSNFFEPYSLALYSFSDPAWRIASLMYLQDEMVVLHSSSTLTVQNCTKAAVVDTNDVFYDRVDNQPVKGYIYEFSNGDPRLKGNMLQGTGITPTTTDCLYSTGDMRGAVSFGSSVLSGPTSASNFVELPVPKLWRNCVKASKIVLDPGFIKKVSIRVQYKNKLPELLKKFRISVASAGTPEQFSMLRSHKCQIVAVEEVLRTSSANKVSLYFEREGKVGAYSYTKKAKKTLTTYYRQGTIDQVETPIV